MRGNQTSVGEGTKETFRDSPEQGEKNEVELGESQEGGVDRELWEAEAPSDIRDFNHLPREEGEREKDSWGLKWHREGYGEERGTTGERDGLTCDVRKPG